jgi:hypothetical protein
MGMEKGRERKEVEFSLQDMWVWRRNTFDFVLLFSWGK